MSAQHSLASYRGYLFAAWTDEAIDISGDDRLYYGQFNTASGEWARIKPSAALLPVTGGTGPSLATDGKTLFAAWKGRQGDSQLSFCMMFGTGLGWAWPTDIPEAVSSTAPALAMMDNTLYAAWAGRRVRAGGHALMYSTAAIRSGFAVGNTAFAEPSSIAPAAREIPGAFAKNAPTLAVSDDGRTLYAAWVQETKNDAGNDSGGEASEDGHIWFATFRASEGWSVPTPLGIKSPHAPSMAAYNGEMWLAWRESHEQTLQFQNLRCLLAGATGLTILPEIASSGNSPAVAECNGKLYAMWRDARSLSLASFDGLQWTVLDAAPRYR